MKRSDRLNLISSLAQRLADRDWDDIQLVLREFGIEAGSYNSMTDPYEYLLRHLPDMGSDELVELDDYLGGRPEEALQGSSGPWEDDHFRLFLSHLSEHKVFLGEVKKNLATYGIDGFVAHSDIKPTKEWIAVIELALGTCDALAAFLHPGFVESRWCDQEVGYVYGRRRVLVSLMFGGSPHGFLGLRQGVQCNGRTEAEVAAQVFGALWEQEELRPKLQDALVVALRGSPNYREANVRSQLVQKHVDRWTPERVGLLEEAADNHQVTEAWTSGPIVKQLLKQNSHVLAAPVASPPADEDVPF